jgi:hypothetical protein
MANEANAPLLVCVCRLSSLSSLRHDIAVKFVYFVHWEMTDGMVAIQFSNPMPIIKKHDFAGFTSIAVRLWCQGCQKFFTVFLTQSFLRS